jgi:2-dehydro-3-deoxygluconokinase
MKSSLNIPPNGALDFLALGALVHRLDPGVVPFRKATHCAIHVSGGEYNVAANLADCFRLKTGIATAMVDYPIGDLIAERVRAAGVQPFYKRFSHDGVRGPNMATVYSDRGFGMRPPVVVYNRSNEAAALLKPGDFDWSAIFGAGVRWFHSGGIFAALSESTASLILEAMRAAKAAGAVVSFDVNYRPKLWRARGGPDAAGETFRAILPLTDVLIAGRGDIEHVLDNKRDASADPSMDPDAYFDACARLAKGFPNLRAITTSFRTVLSANRHRWSAAAWLNEQVYLAPSCEIDVLDRVGSGDGYAAGFFYGLLSGADPNDAVKLGWAHGALLTTYPGDTTMATLEQVLELARGGSAQIQR